MHSSNLNFSEPNLLISERQDCVCVGFTVLDAIEVGKDAWSALLARCVHVYLEREKLSIFALRRRWKANKPRSKLSLGQKRFGNGYASANLAGVV